MIWLLACFLGGECFHSFSPLGLRQPLIRTNQYLQRTQHTKVGREFRYRLRASEEDDDEDETNEWDEDDLDPPPAETVPLYPTVSVKNVEV